VSVFLFIFIFVSVFIFIFIESSFFISNTPNETINFRVGYSKQMS